MERRAVALLVWLRWWCLPGGWSQKIQDTLAGRGRRADRSAEPSPILVPAEERSALGGRRQPAERRFGSLKTWSWRVCLLKIDSGSLLEFCGRVGTYRGDVVATARGGQSFSWWVNSRWSGIWVRGSRARTYVSFRMV